MAPVTPRGRGGSFRSRGGSGGGRGGSRGGGRGGRGGRGYDEGPPAEIVGKTEKVLLLVVVILPFLLELMKLLLSSYPCGNCFH